MKSILFFPAALLILTAISCSKEDERVIDSRDYESYLQRGSDLALTKCNEEMSFWNGKLAAVPESETYRMKLAGLFSSRFMLNGRIEDIWKSDSLYHLVLSNTTQDYASVHRALAANCITQHKFREARDEIYKALEIGEGKAASYYMMVDVDIELGLYTEAKVAMRNFSNKIFFPYMIREAKIKDHEGHLDSAILIMEKTLTQIQENASLLEWTQSNLADMYGHAGRVENAYNMYLAILKRNPDYDYALKGIAWIAFSHDHNYTEAKKLVNVVLSKRATPDMHLLLAQIAEVEKNQTEKEKQLAMFTASASSPKYGDMYNKYMALLEADQFSNAKRTIEIAEIEIKNRPTPQSYDLLAWGHLRNGDQKEALAIASEYIENKTFEPDALFHLAMIYSANGNKDKAEQYFEEASASSFELGPIVTSQIQSHLN